jgi:hypothetical protein
MQTQIGMLLFVLVASHTASAGPVYRCPGADGVVRFMDRSCPGIGEEIPESKLQANVYTPVPLATRDAVEEAPVTYTDEITGCKNAEDLRHIDLMLKSLTTDKKQLRFLKAERKRVANCQLESLSPADRDKRDAALRRTRSLRDDTRVAAELEIEGLYGAKRPAKRPRKRR